jgi:hypothetical protein
MIITEKQLLVLLDILKDSFKGSIEIDNQFSLARKQRMELYEIIMNQQDFHILRKKKAMCLS